MKKKRSKPAKPSSSRQKPSPGNAAVTKSTQAPLKILFQIVKPLVFIGVIWILVDNNKGYDRLYRSNVLKIFADIKKYGDLSYDEKLSKLLGMDYRYLDYVRQATPPDAVILAPPKKIWKPEGRNLGFGNWMHSKSYVSYLLYPRKVIYDNKDDADSPLRDKVTHVMIVDSWGYDKLEYEVGEQEQFSVMPIKKPIR